MRNITFSADENHIALAREQADHDGSSLNEQFRLWLERYARQRQAARAMDTIDRLSKYVDTGGRKFTRDEMNER